MPKTGDKVRRAGEYKCKRDNFRIQARKNLRFPKCKKCESATDWVLVSPKS